MDGERIELTNNRKTVKKNCASNFLGLSFKTVHNWPAVNCGDPMGREFAVQDNWFKNKKGSHFQRTIVDGERIELPTFWV